MSGMVNKQVKSSNCNELLVKDNGAITAEVIIVDDLPGGKLKESRSYFDKQDAVASGLTITVNQFTVPVGHQFYLQRIEFGGGNIAIYSIYADAALIARERTYFGGQLSDVAEFASDPKSGIKYPAGTVLSVQVENFRPVAADFEARIQGILEEL